MSTISQVREELSSDSVSYASLLLGRMDFSEAIILLFSLPSPMIQLLWAPSEGSQVPVF